MKKVLVACGNGAATSTMVALKLRSAFQEHGMNVDVIQCKLMEIPSKADQVDVIVTTGKYDKGNLDKPVISAMSLLTGIGEEDTIKKIIDQLA